MCHRGRCAAHFDYTGVDGAMYHIGMCIYFIIFTDDFYSCSLLRSIGFAGVQVQDSLLADPLALSYRILAERRSRTVSQVGLLRYCR